MNNYRNNQHRNMSQRNWPNMQRQQNMGQKSVKQENSVNEELQKQIPNGVNSQQFDNLVNTAGKYLNQDPNDLKKAAQSGSMNKLLSNMSPSQAAQLERILSDENAAKKLLSTPQAQALLRELNKNE
ncbi:MAG: hypothetical protein K2M82_06330 [Lachnospiraceae bacterium]|nr:hypothetical protein [Lachnospiraceae bacterium]